ncbi:MAG: outer membrane protein assembly factor BamB [Verrucomicrobiales bacterium]|jgi:outer membrane protein assembly factor BamB
MKKTLLLILAANLLATSIFANWPEFRGPTRDGHAPADGQQLPTEWSEDKNITWRTEIHGKGWSTPVVWGDQVWVTTATEDGKEQSVLCIDRVSGKVLFDEVFFENAEPRPLSNKRNTYASPSPTIVEGRVYVHFGSYGTACIDTKNFKTVWTRPDFECHHWRGPASSAVIFGDLLILTFDGADHHFSAALNKETGETVWRRDRSTNYNDLDKDGKPKAGGDMRKAYNTPVFINFGGQTQMISPGAKCVWSYDPKTGAENWSAHFNEHSTASRTVFSEELGLMFVNTGYGKSRLIAYRIDSDAKGEIGESHLAWQTNQRTPNRSSPLLIDGRIFMVTDGGVGSCLDGKTGDEIWSERIGGEVSASLLYGGGHIYWFDETGKCVVTEAGAEFKSVAENQLDDGVFSSPAAAGNSLFVRTTTHLYRIDG